MEEAPETGLRKMISREIQPAEETEDGQGATTSPPQVHPPKDLETGTAATVPLQIMHSTSQLDEETGSVDSRASDLTDDYHDVKAFRNPGTETSSNDSNSKMVPIWKEVVRYGVIFAAFGSIVGFYYLR